MTADHVARVAAAIGSSMMPDNDQWTNRFTVRSETSDAVYVVAQRRSDMTWGCSCWAWRTKRRCKHLDKMLARLASLAALPTPQPYDAATTRMLASARTAFLDLDVSPVRIAARRNVRKIDL